ncbi:pyridoxamine 5'-phosphate oxidase family protein [Nocardiopsis sp. HNM0947]|uniref:Pyridoxamine 5'-phosphate oxidase family protein n=1 Tax=Nocardiopsis coralli TaxID=2772213 RepID=A0ABR9PDP7_9ACTN|nr:pyridoxamine 5'-phosphate oxidase family protein [Nocardiopsis coralli]MBE3001941.1 pyridoxamine 5'-phosphate oxidase family protein [Nocardiopsis coralli]
MSAAVPTPPTPELHPDYSDPSADPTPWAAVVEAVQRAEIFWLTTVRRDGRPHVTPLPAIWLDGVLYFCTGAEEQKAVNLAAEDRCILTTGSDRFRSGLDVVVEGTAARVTEEPLLRRLADLWLEKLDWPWVVADGAFQHETGGAALVFGLTPHKVLAFSKGDPFAQTRFRFQER